MIRKAKVVVVGDSASAFDQLVEAGLVETGKL